MIARAYVSADCADAPAALRAELGPGPFAAVLIFASPEADLPALATADLGGPVLGCTTAGELGPDGYAEGGILAIGLPSRDFAAELMGIPDLATIPRERLIGDLVRARAQLAARCDWPGEFAFLLVDGLSVREDVLAAGLAAGLGPVPLCGGSAADGTRFQAAQVLIGGQSLRDAAVLLRVRARGRVRVFSLDHLRPTERCMVVTEADPALRIVRQINAEPAAPEYARLLGKDPGQLDTFTFAAHPVAVRLGGRHHVRAIRELRPNGDLVFFSAIDEGLVLHLAEPQDMTAHLRAELSALGQPAAVLACDCILRRMEAQEKQLTPGISALLRQHRVLGFSTYGEQVNGLHVNQTMTGVAFWPAEDTTPEAGSETGPETGSAPEKGHQP